MTKIEIIGQIFDVLNELEEYDSHYYPEPAQKYMRYDKSTLQDCYLKMKSKLDTAKQAKESGSRFFQVRVRIPDTIDLFIHEYQLCRNVGCGFVPLREAVKSDFKKYPVVI